jgi:hypothetical protein
MDSKEPYMLGSFSLSLSRRMPRGSDNSCIRKKAYQYSNKIQLMINSYGLKSIISANILGIEFLWQNLINYVAHMHLSLSPRPLTAMHVFHIT